MAGFYLSVYCPFCGRKLQEEYRGTRRLGVCARDHAWRVTASLEGYRLEEVREEERSKEQEGVSYRAIAW